MENTYFYKILDAELDAIIKKNASDEEFIKRSKNDSQSKSYAFMVWFLEFYGKGIFRPSGLPDGDDGLQHRPDSPLRRRSLQVDGENVRAGSIPLQKNCSGCSGCSGTQACNGSASRSRCGKRSAGCGKHPSRTFRRRAGCHSGRRRFGRHRAVGNRRQVSAHGQHGLDMVGTGPGRPSLFTQALSAVSESNHKGRLT